MVRIGLIGLIAFGFSSFYGGFLAFLAFENKSSNASLDPFPPGPTASSDQGVRPNKNAHLLIGRALTFPVVKYFPGRHVFDFSLNFKNLVWINLYIIIL